MELNTWRKRSEPLVVFSLEVNKVGVKFVVHVVSVVYQGVVVDLQLIKLRVELQRIDHPVVPFDHEQPVSVFQEGLGVIPGRTGNRLQPDIETGLNDDDLVIGFFV